MFKYKGVLIFFLLFSLPIVSGAIQSLPDAVKTGQCVTLPQSYANSSFQNITTIQLPDETILIINSSMQNLGGGYFNYSFCNTTQNGRYIVNGIGDTDGTVAIWNYDFLVNPLGKIFTSQQATLYFLMFVVSFLLFLGSFIFGIYAPSSNKRDQMTGYIIAVDNLKYVKIFMLAISYLLLMLIVYFGWMISYGYLDLDFLGNLFNFSFYFLAILLLPLFIVGAYVVIANWVRDSKLAEDLSRGFKIR